MAPLALSDEEIDLLRALALPLGLKQRPAFMEMVSEILGDRRGIGQVHQAAREAQRKLFNPPTLSEISKGGRERLLMKTPVSSS
jgi:hypothetical protein